MRNCLLLLLSFMFAVCALNAQSLQKVRVLEYKSNGQKTPLANVEVIVGNAGSVVTNKKGICEFLEAKQFLLPLFNRYHKKYIGILHGIYINLCDLYGNEGINNPAKLAEAQQEKEAIEAEMK